MATTAALITRLRHNNEHTPSITAAIDVSEWNIDSYLPPHPTAYPIHQFFRQFNPSTPPLPIKNSSVYICIYPPSTQYGDDFSLHHDQTRPIEFFWSNETIAEDQISATSILSGTP